MFNIPYNTAILLLSSASRYIVLEPLKGRQHSEEVIGKSFISAVCRSWYRRWSDQRSYSTSGPVSTGMGDRIGFNSYTGQLSLAIPPWVGAMSTGQRAAMLCGWGVKAGMARVWWQIKLV